MNTIATEEKRSNRLVHRLAARELTPAELEAISGGLSLTRGASAGTISCSACCADDCDMSAAVA